MLKASSDSPTFFDPQALVPGRMTTLISVNRDGFVGSIVPSGLVSTYSSVHQPLPADSSANRRPGSSPATCSRPNPFSKAMISAGKGTTALIQNQRGVWVKNDAGLVNSVEVGCGVSGVVVSEVRVWFPLYPIDVIRMSDAVIGPGMLSGNGGSTPASGFGMSGRESRLLGLTPSGEVVRYLVPPFDVLTMTPTISPTGTSTNQE